MTAVFTQQIGGSASASVVQRLAVVVRAVQLAASRPEVDARGIVRVDAEPVAQHALERVLLREPVVSGPTSPGVLRAVDAQLRPGMTRNSSDWIGTM